MFNNSFLTECPLWVHSLQITIKTLGNSLAVQWLGLSALIAGSLGSISGQGTKFPQAAECGPKKENKAEMSI